LTFQRRLAALLAHAGVGTYPGANEMLQMEIQRQNRTVLRSTGRMPMDVLDKRTNAHAAKLRPCPLVALLDLHCFVRVRRRVNNDHPVDFEGQNHEIACTTKMHVSIQHHPGRKFQVHE
jgi:hypothetical protein